MRPDWERDGIQLYCADCMDVLPHLSGVDAVVTDPPFGIGFKYESHDDSPEGYGKWIWSVISSCEAICSEGSPMFVWQTMKNVRHFHEWFPRDYRIFAAAKNFVQLRPTPMQYSYDPVICWWTEGEKWASGTASRDFHIANTAPVVASPLNIEKGHPCPRPLDQVTHMVEQWCKPESVVLDPFMGSGTTGVACVKLGRKFIGIEKEPKYFDIAVKRIERALSEERSSLFPVAKEIQRELI